MRLRLQESSRSAPLSIDIPNVRDDDDFIELIDTASSPKSLSFLVSNIGKAFKNGHKPVQCEECTSGTYFLEDSEGHCNGVFKPLDEEPTDMIKGISVGEASVRECAAYFLDHGHFANVPATDLVVCQHSRFSDHAPEYPQWTSLWEEHASTRARAKLGSFQEYMEHDGDFDEMSRRQIAEFPVFQVQKVAMLDIRIFNTDRHGGNLLYKNGPSGRKSAMLIPIDHGYSLPSTLDEALFVWLDWPQVNCKMVPEVKEYIANLNVEVDVQILKDKFPQSFGDEHFSIMRLTAMLLKKGAALDLTLNQIGSLICRLDFNMPSPLEQIVSKVQAMHDDLMPAFAEAYEQDLDNCLADIEPDGVEPSPPTAVLGRKLSCKDTLPIAWSSCFGRREAPLINA